MKFAEKLRKERLSKNLSQEQLALMAEITTAYLGQIERNEKNPTVAVVGKICMALEIELSDFFSKNEIVQKELDPLTTQILYQVKNEEYENCKTLYNGNCVPLSCSDFL